MIKTSTVYIAIVACLLIVVSQVDAAYFSLRSRSVLAPNPVSTNGSAVGVGTSSPSTMGDLVVDSSATGTVKVSSSGANIGGCLELESPLGGNFHAYATTTGPLILNAGSCK